MGVSAGAMRMLTNWDAAIEPIAKVGYETMFDDSWDSLPPNSIERSIWRKVAAAMVGKLWEMYQRDQSNKAP